MGPPLSSQSVGPIMARIDSVDTIRVIAITAVIAIHIGPFRHMSAGSLGPFELWLVINQLGRFAVPFFFVVSGFFWGQKIDEGRGIVSTSIAMSRRIITIFIGWSVIYLCVDVSLRVRDVYRDSGSAVSLVDIAKHAYWFLIVRLSDPVTILFEGTREHLWFLAALVWCVAISAVLIAKGCTKTLIGLAAFLYVLGLLGKAYAQTPLGIDMPINTRDGPFFGLLLFTTGYLLAKRRTKVNAFQGGLVALLVGIVLHFAEVGYLNHRFGTDLAQDYVVGTYLMGVGAALIALSNRDGLRSAWSSSIGPHVLGIYAIHQLFVQLLKPLAAESSSALWNYGWQTALVPLILGSSFLGSRLLARHPITRTLVI